MRILDIAAQEILHEFGTCPELVGQIEEQLNISRDTAALMLAQWYWSHRFLLLNIDGGKERSDKE